MTVWRVVDIIKSSSDFLEKKGVPDACLDAETLLGDILKKNRPPYSACANQVLQTMMGQYSNSGRGRSDDDRDRSGQQQGISTGAVVGIVVGVVAVGVLVVVLTRQKS